jgi:hypothetical protein
MRYDDLYTGVIDSLKPGGTFVLREAVVSWVDYWFFFCRLTKFFSGNVKGGGPLRSAQALSDSLLFAGFMTASSTPIPADRVLEVGV